MNLMILSRNVTSFIRSASIYSASVADVISRLPLIFFWIYSEGPSQVIAFGSTSSSAPFLRPLPPPPPPPRWVVCTGRGSFITNTEIYTEAENKSFSSLSTCLLRTYWRPSPSLSVSFCLFLSLSVSFCLFLSLSVSVCVCHPSALSLSRLSFISVLFQVSFGAMNATNLADYLVRLSTGQWNGLQLGRMPMLISHPSLIINSSRMNEWSRLAAISRPVPFFALCLPFQSGELTVLFSSKWPILCSKRKASHLHQSAAYFIGKQTKRFPLSRVLISSWRRQHSETSAAFCFLTVKQRLQYRIESNQIKSSSIQSLESAPKYCRLWKMIFQNLIWFFEEK